MTNQFTDAESGNVLSVTTEGDGTTVGIDFRHVGVRVSVGARLDSDQVTTLTTALCPQNAPTRAYTIRLLRAAFRGLGNADTLCVRFTHRGVTYEGTVTGMGGSLGVNVDGELFEDIAADQVTHADIRPRNMSAPAGTSRA